MADQQSRDSIRADTAERVSALPPGNKTAKNVLIVAHPDDETLWGVGRVLAQPYQWDLIVVSRPVNDPARIDQFWRATSHLPFRDIMLLHAQDADSRTPIDFELPNIRHYDLALTHNERGEYGHMHHKQVHAAVKAQRHDLVCFGWGLDKPDADLRLPPEHLEIKIAALREYGHWFDLLVNAYFKRDPRNLERETYADCGVRL